jgi:hypothetical protein
MLQFKDYCIFRTIIDEDKKADYEYYKKMGWEGNPDEIWLYDTGPTKKATTTWSVLMAVRDILSKDVTVEEWDPITEPTDEEVEPGVVYVMKNLIRGKRTAFFPRMVGGKAGGIIYINNYESRNSDEIAMAVHEAYHARLWIKAKGQGVFHGNEKVVNDLAEAWLKKNLNGFNLQVAMDKLGLSRKGYGINKAQYVTPTHNEKDLPKNAAYMQSFEFMMKQGNAQSKKHQRISQGLPLSPTKRLKLNH